MAWIKHPTTLQGARVILAPLQRDHFDALIKAAANKEIWRLFYFDGSNKYRMLRHLEEAMELREKNQEYTFTVIDKQTNEVIGSTRYLKINREHRNLEIGVTWYKQEYWGKGYNEECKLLLLSHCFETLKTIRVLIAAWDKNLRSRKAIERIGAKFEGILRNAIIRNGDIRSVAYYSILQEEWEEVKNNLLGLIKVRAVSFN